MSNATPVNYMLQHMSQFKDFEGEFQPIKKYNLHELQADKFLLRLNRERQLNRSDPQIKTEQHLEPLRLTTNDPKPARSKRKVVLSGTNELKEKIEKKKSKKKLILVGTSALQEMLERKRAEQEQARRAALEDSDGHKNKKRKKLKVKLIPFLQKPPRINKVSDNGENPTTTNNNNNNDLSRDPESNSDQSLDLDDEFVDAELNFHEITMADLEGLTPIGNERTTQIEVDESDSDESTELYESAQPVPDTLKFLETQSAAHLHENGGNEEDELVFMEESQTDGHNQSERGNGAQESSNGRQSNGTGGSETKISQNGSNANLNFTASASDIALMKLIIKPQLSGLTFSQLDKSLLAPAYQEVYTLIEHTIRDSEGHSLLLVGPRGSGKSYIADKAIAELRAKYGNQLILIKLNALLHTDDKLALREIARQLDIHSRNMSQELKDTFEQRAISDTFANILKILDSNSRGGELVEDGQSVPVVIMIDEIEKFTGDGKQTLLYNLFELSQSSKTPICVIGISTKATTRELLEKRVRSRFSQRIVSVGRAPTIDIFWENARLNLLVPEENFSDFSDREYPKFWNEKIEHLYQYPSGFKKVFTRIFHTTKNFKDVYNCCQLPVSVIAEKSPFPRGEDFEIYMTQLSPGYAQLIVESLSNLELLLAIAAARWITKSELRQVNFNLAYAEYTDMIKRLNLEATTLSANSSFVDSTVLASIKVNQKIWSSKVMRDCWANLYNMGLLFDVITSNNEVNVNNNFNMYKNMVIEDSKMLQIDMSLEELGLLISKQAPFRKLTRL